MDPPSAKATVRRTTSRGKGRGGSRLGMKAYSPAPSPPPASSPATAPAPPSQISAPAVPSVRPPSPQVSPSPQVQAPAAPMFTLPPRPPQEAGLGAVPPNSWVYPPGGFVNFIQQSHYPPQPQRHGENFHLVGQTMNFNPNSQSPPNAYGTTTPEAVIQGTSTNETVNIDIDEDDNEEKVTVKRRYWTHEEEERLASAWLNASKDPIKGNDQKGDTFWNEVTDVFNKNGNGKRTRELNQLKILEAVASHDTFCQR